MAARLLRLGAAVASAARAGAAAAAQGFGESSAAPAGYGEQPGHGEQDEQPQQSQDFHWEHYADAYTSGGGFDYSKYMQGAAPANSSSGGFDYSKYMQGAASANSSSGGFDYSKYMQGGAPSAPSEANGTLAQQAGGSGIAGGAGFATYLTALLPPGDHDKYVGQWTGQWSNMTAPMEAMYSTGKTGYSQYVKRYESMAGAHPAAAGSWQSKAQEQRGAYASAVGKDVPYSADTHYLDQPTGKNKSTGEVSLLEAPGPREASDEAALPGDAGGPEDASGPAAAAQAPTAAAAEGDVRAAALRGAAPAGVELQFPAEEAAGDPPPQESGDAPGRSLNIGHLWLLPLILGSAAACALSARRITPLAGNEPLLH